MEVKGIIQDPRTARADLQSTIIQDPPMSCASAPYAG